MSNGVRIEIEMRAFWFTIPEGIPEKMLRVWVSVKIHHHIMLTLGAVAERQ